eukprot:scaffold52812_cov17-Tisochrysis_lutea.AAC.1
MQGAIFLYIVDPQTVAVPQEASTQAGKSRVAAVLATLQRSAHAALNLMSKEGVCPQARDLHGINVQCCWQHVAALTSRWCAEAEMWNTYSSKEG